MRTTLCESKCLEQLLSAEELGDCKLTQLLRRMQQPSPQIYSALHSKVVELHQDMAAIKETLAELQLDRSTHQRGMVKVAGACHSPTTVDAVPHTPGPTRILPVVPCAGTTPILVRQSSAANSHTCFRSVSGSDVVDRTYSILRR